MPGILIVEDNPVTRRLFRLLLTEAGYEVHEAPDALRALDLARQHAPHLVIQDLLLPGGDGLDLPGALRLVPGLERMVIVACTGSLAKVEEARRQPAGFDGFLIKPVPPSRLLAEVRARLAAA